MPANLAAFFPDHQLVAADTPGVPALVLDPDRAPARGPWMRGSEALWRAPRFGRRHAPVGLLVAPVSCPRADPMRVVLDGPVPPGSPPVGEVVGLLRALRVGGAPGLPDPGGAALDMPGGAVLVLDPCRRDRAAAARDMLLAARATAAGRPILLAGSPDAPAGAGPVLEAADLRRLPGRLAPWTLIDLASAVHGVDDPTALLALVTGVAAFDHGGAPWARQDGAAVLARLVAATRWADPFRDRPWTAEAALRQLADWRVAEAANRHIVAAVGVEWFKHGAIKRALASQAGAPRIFARGGAGLRHARRRGGALAVWSAAMPPGLPARAAAAGVPLVQVEDGFIRSAGLGMRLAPALSLVLDSRGIHFDPGTPSDLEHLLATGDFDAALLARARQFRMTLLARGVTKYNLSGTVGLPALPADRPTILVPGQVEDDAALRRGDAAIRTNLGLLRTVRRAAPSAYVLFKPHPDVTHGQRAGAVPRTALAGLADAVVGDVPIAALYARVGAVHTMASLAGFEALLRGTPVVTWGKPFYAGWGLTEDRDPPPRRGRALTLDMLVAGALLLHPYYRDPRTGLPCPAEVALERLAATTRPAAGPKRPAMGRAVVAGISHRLATWWAAR